MSNMKYDCVFWDWNGTIFDDVRASLDAVNKMLARRSLPPIDLKTYREYVDTPILKFYEKTFDMSCEDMDNLAVEFNSAYREFLGDEPLRKGVSEVLSELSAMGVRQCIFSASANAIINRYLTEHKLARYFEAVLGADNYYVESKLNRTINYLKTTGIDPKRTVFIGDAEHDLEVARACGGDCILVTGGHRPESALRNSGAYVISSVIQLPELIKG